jgi:glycosyltransferase involved in cell wall biosynthesis
MTALLVLDALVVLGWVLFCAVLPFSFRMMPRARAATSGSGSGRLSLILPARNEEKILPRCLDSALAQHRRPDEIIVVDDDSKDATARLAIERGARVISPGPRPDGWGGKSWAAQAGAKVATGDWLLFVDADGIFAPDCFGAALAEAEAHHADLLSFFPKWRCDSLFQKLVMPINYIILSLAFDANRVNNPKDPLATAWGGFLLFRRSAYDRVGGHLPVKAYLYEDRAFAQEIKKKGMTLRVAAAQELVTTARPMTARRMLNDVCRGAYEYGQGRWSLLALGAWAHFVIFLGPYVLIPLGPRFAELALVYAVSSLLVRMQYGWAAKLDYRLALLQPVGSLYLVGITLWASVLTMTGRAVTHWGAREYKG